MQLRPLRRSGAVAVRNVGAAPLDLDGTRVMVDGRAREVGPGAMLPPRAELRLDVPWLPREGGTAALETYAEVRLAAVSWPAHRRP